MIENKKYNNFSSLRIGILGPVHPPMGGIAVLNKLLCRKLKSEGVKLTIIDTRAGQSFEEHHNFLNRILRFFVIIIEMINKWNKFDILHIHSTTGDSFLFIASFWIVVGRFFGKRTVLTIHGSKAQRFFPRLGNYGASILKMTHMISTPTDYLADYFTEFGIKKWRVVPNFIDDKLFKSRIRIPKKPVLLNIIKRNGEMQNTREVIQAFQKIKLVYPEAELVFIGKTRERNALNRLIKQNSITGIRFVGTVDYKYIPEFYAKADIFINVPDFESFGLTIVEAFLSGLPVIATGVGGVSKLVEHGENGFLIKPGNWKELSQNVLKLVKEQDLYQAVSKNAHKTGQKYIWKKLRDKYFEFYVN